MARKRWHELRTKSDKRRRKSLTDGTAWIKRVLEIEDEPEKTDKPRKKGRKETAKRLTSADQ